MVQSKHYVSVHIGSKFMQVHGLVDQAIYLFFHSLSAKLEVQADFLKWYNTQVNVHPDRVRVWLRDAH